MRSVTRSLEVLESIADLQPVGVSDIARHLGEPKSSIQRALDSLAKGRWITRQETAGGLWIIAVRTALLGRAFAAQSGLTTAALDRMEELRQITQETIHLAVPREASVILVERLESPQLIRYVEPMGGAASIFLTATGKSILAALPETEVTELIEENLHAFEETSPTPEELLQELRTIKQHGFATTSRWRTEVFAIASAIVDEGGHPIAALSISAPQSRVSEEQKITYADLVTTAARDISRRIRGLNPNQLDANTKNGAAGPADT